MFLILLFFTVYFTDQGDWSYVSRLAGNVTDVAYVSQVVTSGHNPAIQSIKVQNNADEPLSDYQVVYIVTRITQDETGKELIEVLDATPLTADQITISTVAPKSSRQLFVNLDGFETQVKENPLLNSHLSGEYAAYIGLSKATYGNQSITFNGMKLLLEQGIVSFGSSGVYCPKQECKWEKAPFGYRCRDVNTHNVWCDMEDRGMKCTNTICVQEGTPER